MGRLIILLLFFVSFLGYGQVSLCTWNVENLGNSKSENDVEYIASKLKNYDVVAIQEVVAGFSGSQAVAKLADKLNRKGEKWEYVVSDPTSGSSYKTERYAFLWKPSKVKLIGKPWLEQKYNQEIDREPYFATFECKGKVFTLINFHAITKKMQPETEIKYFKYFFADYASHNLIFVGDFNCPQSHSVFNPWLKKGYLPAFVNQKTTLKMECKHNDCLASEFDNIWYNKEKVKVESASAINFYDDFENLQQARQISDHIPLVITFNLK